MSYYNTTNLRTNKSKSKVIYGGLFESIFYETKPFLYIAIASMAMNNHYGEESLARLSVGVLFAAAAYIIYCRLVHRGYIK